ncbi:hypothetical protein N7495_004953 [Penicillium taxi]|uniref:uncharacterized protein n=1 Tax=Penicillium taxi TaxID=168475 RepID=UPI002544D61C|nr:uncharacterized protein N7495_004953 [Penicillium taxi]KAJ5893262.1 hypothetical protein N7495_004953 [Penicillium taxi]
MGDNDPLRSPREHTVIELARILDAQTFIHVRGTPASGKTTLARLLEAFYRKKNVPVIAFYSWSLTAGQSYKQVLMQEARERGYTQFDRQFLQDGSYVLIIDEGQLTYQDEAFWIEMIKMQSRRHWGPRICMFTCYGSPTEGSESINIAGSPLAHLGPEQRVSITVSHIEYSPSIALFYDATEFFDVVVRFCVQSHRIPELRLDSTAQRYIFELTHGHPGAVDAMLQMLWTFYHSALKHQGLIITDEHIIQSLDNEEKAFQLLMSENIRRSFPRRGKVTTEAVEILRKTLSDGSVTKDLANPGVKQCYENGWLHSEPKDFDGDEILCVFPTRLHAKFVEYYWTSNKLDFPIWRFPDIGCLAREVLAQFSPRNISSAIRMGYAAMARPFEASYQDEFYRASHQVLGYAMNVTSEWSSGGRGRIDFRFAQIGWGVELIREGDRLKEHCSRFAPGGTYAPWISTGLLTQWLIIDCRTSWPKPLNPPEPKLWRAVFSEDFGSVQILDSSNSPIGAPIPLMS